ncbi:hypothetical protein GCM10020000_38500 [Streptomyces olivoverticillatus]
MASGSVTATEGEALHDAETGQYLYEVDVKGGCPTCSHGTSGNICEECGEPNVVTDLQEPVSTVSDTAPRKGTVTRFSLPLHEFRDTLEDHHRVGRVPARLRELAHRLFARPRLDIPVTHPSSWGVPPAEREGDGQVIWVWPEMSYGFLHGIQELGSRLDRGWKAADPGQDWKIVHFFGYDNSFYHSVLYPVLYKLAFPEWAPDIDYHVNEFYLLEGSKFSTSRRHAVWGKEILGPDSVDAVRYFLSRTRPEGERTDFRMATYETALQDTLIGTWQAWLNDLGSRIGTAYDGAVPDAGTWTPEQSAFLGRLSTRLTALTGALGPDAFSLRQAAAELDGIVEDTVAFSRRESLLAKTDAWHSEARTAVALELAAARLLAHGAAPVMPRFAARLAEALGLPEPGTWPETVELVAPGTRVRLADAVFFRPTGETSPEPAAGPALLPWLADTVKTVLQLLSRRARRRAHAPLARRRLPGGRHRAVPDPRTARRGPAGRRTARGPRPDRAGPTPRGARRASRRLPHHRGSPAMTYPDILREIESRGLAISIEGGDLRLQGSRDRMDPEFIARIKAAKPELIACLTEEARGSRGFPLTLMQRSYLLGRSGIFEIGDVASHVYHEIEGAWDLDRLEAALTAVVRRHSALRSRFPGDDRQAEGCARRT